VGRSGGRRRFSYPSVLADPFLIKRSIRDNISASMKSTLFLLLLGFGVLSIVARADNRNKGIHPRPVAKITPCAPGVVYVKMKVGSSTGRTVGSNGNVILLIAPSTSFAVVASTLGLKQTVIFDPHATKDSISRAFGIDRMYCLYYSNTKIDPHTALTMLMKTGEIECGSVRYLFPVTRDANDPLVSEQYALTAMNVFNAWNTTFGDTSIVIADVDNAINIDHVDLKDEIKYNWGEIGIDAQGHDKRSNGIDDDSDGYIDNWEGWDFCGNVDVGSGAILEPNNNPRPRPPFLSAVGEPDHGTLTAGCIVATGNNGIGIAGIAFGCKLLPIKVAGADNNDISAGFEGIHYASTHGARIINCSWGGSLDGFDTAFSNTFLVEARVRGALVIAAAGNGINDDGIPADNDDYPEYPSNGPYVLSVGASDQNNQAAGFSNYGNSVSVWAPGSGILSCDYPGDSSYSGDNNGTSFASPNTAGVAGLLWSEHLDWSPQFIAAQIIATCANVVNTGDRFDYWGLVNADSALNTTLVGPGLVITGYALDGVTADSLGPNHTYDFKVTFENVLSAGTNLTAVPIPALGVQLSSNRVILGSLAESAIATGDFQISQTGVYSQGNVPISFAVSDGNGYNDTLSLYLPLNVQPGFIPGQTVEYGTSVCRLSNTVAWASFGEESNDGLGDTTYFAEFALEAGGIWGDTGTLGDGINPPYDVTALDSNTAYFGSGPPGGTASVIHTSDGGNTFDTVSVASFAEFVNTIHFFDPLNGILIGDPLTNSSRWGIGITSDGGQSWQSLGKPISTQGSGVSSWNNATCWVGTNGWFGTNSQHIWRTTDRGQTWAPAETPFQNSLGVAFDDDATHGLACFQPESGVGNNGIAFSTDSGTSWQQLTTLPMDSLSPASVAFIPNSNIAILTSDMGIYRTTDLGETWSPIGIPVSYSAAGSAISISRTPNEFVVSINSPINGVATYSEMIPDTSTEVVTSLPVTALSLVVYPNPSEMTATVSFTLPVSGHARMVMYDALGRAVQNVLDGTFDAGTHQVVLDAHALIPGVYYLDFYTDAGGVVTRTLTVIP
jgi:photosystem II stability/assembly factor-like uncharacterized protein